MHRENKYGVQKMKLISLGNSKLLPHVQKLKFLFRNGNDTANKCDRNLSTVSGKTLNKLRDGAYKLLGKPQETAPHESLPCWISQSIMC